MSHQPERTEKNCLNCGTTVEGRYCQQCGQENIVTHQNFWAMTKHFVYDLFHFDGKFFDTFTGLFRYPGKVPQEYIAGRRMSYLDPIRMYLFTSALFFLVFFSTRQVNIGDGDFSRELSRSERMNLAMDLQARIGAGPADSNALNARDLLLDSTRIIELRPDSSKAGIPIRYRNQPHKLVASPDSSRQKWAEALEGRSWWERQLLSKVQKMDGKAGGEDSGSVRAKFADAALHSIPYLLFVSLPFFGGILMLLYNRRRQFYYSDHMVFTLYHYIFSFLLLLLVLGLQYLRSISSYSIFGWLTFAALVYWNIYLYKSMRRFYGQGRWKTTGKFLMLLFLGFLSLLLLMILFLLITALKL